MSSILTSQGVVLATAIAAVSGTVILLAAFRHQKTSQTPPRPCISYSTDGNKRLKNLTKKKKRVHFAEDVVEPTGDGVEFRKRHRKVVSSKSSDFDDAEKADEGKTRITGMPANRAALYNGLIRDRVGHRLGYSY